MSAAETARLVASMEMDDRRFRQGAARTMASVNRIDRRLGAFSGAVNRNLGRGFDRVLSRGIQSGFDAIQSGIGSLVELESATTSVDGAIKQMGLTGRVTSAQIAEWANQIESSTEAAFDDKAITAAASGLIRYGKVGPENLKQTLTVMTDLAAKTGSVESASTLLAKALADPEKAAGKLAKQGVILTAQQQKQIKAFVKAGEVGKAQRVILDSLATSTKNAARDAFGPAADAQHKLSDAWEDGTKALAVGFLPLIERVSNTLQTELAKPETLARIKSFGDGLSTAFGKALDFAEKVPWGAIGSGLEKAAGFAQTLIGAFTSLPPEAQATIVALAGLNKLTGGAITGIVGELGKGLIKGVLGMTAGVVHLRAGTVVGGGAPGTVPGGAGGGKGALGKGLQILGAVTVALGAAEIASIVDPVIKGIAMDIHKNLKLPDQNLPLPEFWPWGPKGTPTILPEVFGGNGLLGGTPAAFQRGKFDPSGVGSGGKLDPKAEHYLQLVSQKQGESKAAFEGGFKAVDGSTKQAGRDVVSAARGVDSTARSGLAGATAATNVGSSRIVGAIQANRPIVNTDVRVNVTSSGVEKATTTSTRYGTQNGSAGGGGGANPGKKFD